ncbi:MAG: EpsI family protein [Acidobacteriaceae bacterium]|nr:EpsI family protein [Acidobacteriaceae bacterium]
MKPVHFYVLAAILSCQAVVYYAFSAKEMIPNFRPWSEFPRQVGQWRETQELTEDAASLEQLKPDDYIDRIYHGRDGRQINFFVAYFKTQRTGHAPHSPQACLPGAGWQPVSASVIPISVPAERMTIDANQYIVQLEGQRNAVFYWYQTARHTMASQYSYQFYAIPELLFHGRTDVALVRIITPMQGDDLAPAKAAAFDFIQSAFGSVRLHFPEV